MYLNHLLIIYRNFKRYKGSYFINLAGLSVGLTCVMLIFLWITDELGVDRFHEKDKQLYQVMVNRNNSEEIFTQINSPGPLASAMAQEMPEVEYATSNTSAFRSEKSIISYNDINVRALGDYVQKDFLNMFSYDLIEGNKNQVLNDKNYIVISESLSKRLFNTTNNVVGKVLEVDSENQFQISGVFKDVPKNASRKFEFLLSYELFKQNNPFLLSWENNAPGTCIVLKEGTKIENFNNKIKNFVKTKYPESNVTLFVKPYSDNYLYGNYENGKQSGGRIRYVQLFSIIALFILVIACINFMNLSTARASRRLKEIGIKKAVGAERKNLIAQYLSESMILTLIALVISLVLVYLFLPNFNEITEKDLKLSFNLNIIIGSLIITLVTGLVAGSYPALYLSGFKPAEVLKGEIKTSWREIFIRKGLVIFQFTLSIILIVAVLVVFQQIQYIQSKNLGYSKDEVIYFDREGWAQTNLDNFLSRLRKVEGIVNASSMMGNFIDGKTSTYEVNWKTKNVNDVIDFQYLVVNYEMLETLKIQVKEGRQFSKAFKNEENKIIFNSTAINKMGITDPIGKSVQVFGQNYQIIGIAEDFQSGSLREPVKPMLLIFSPDITNKIYTRIVPGTELRTLSNMKKFYREFNNGYTLDFKFLDSDYQALYSSERKIDILSRYFAGIAIIISCLGLFALAAFTAERRIKEIGIRKVLSASKGSIVMLLTMEFTKLVLVAIVIALPIAYFITRSWLDNFAYRIELQLWHFAASGLVALIIAWATVATQAVKAASKNPIECLRNND